MNTIQTKETKTSALNNYWEQTGKYSAELTALTDKYMPISGYASTVGGEVVRCINRLIHETCNNGNCNAVKWGKPDGGWYNDEDEVVGVDKYYQDMLNYIREFVPGSCDYVSAVRRAIRIEACGDIAYDRLADYCLCYLTAVNPELMEQPSGLPQEAAKQS